MAEQQTCAHDHHGHHHHHEHRAVKNIKLAFWLNFLFALVEIVGGLWTNSMAILSDALHDLGDSLALLSAWVLEKKSLTQSNLDYSYGYRRFSTASALITAVILVAGSVFVIAKSIPRLLNPEATNAYGMIGLAVVGVLVNGAAAYRISKGTSLNERAITWHLIEDLVGWVLVLLGAGIMALWDLPIVDPILALLLSIWVLWNVSKTLKETAKVFLQATPTGVDVLKIEKMIQAVSGVKNVHHTHVWSLDGESHILTAHIVLSETIQIGQGQSVKQEIKKLLKDHFKIVEATLEVESYNEYCDEVHHKSTT